MNSSELNKILSEEVALLRSGKIKPDRTRAVAQATSQIIAAARLEFNYCKLIGIKDSRPSFFSQAVDKMLPRPKRRK